MPPVRRKNISPCTHLMVLIAVFAMVAAGGVRADFFGCLAQRRGPKFTIDELNEIATRTSLATMSVAGMAMATRATNRKIGT